MFVIDTSDRELMRAQFRSFSKHIPLLYIILVINTAAIVITSFRLEHYEKTLIVPAIISSFALARAVWWSRQKNADHLSDEQISAYLRRTCVLAAVQSLTFTLWAIWVYQGLDAFGRSNVTFFLALSQVSTVFCLMTLRVAANLVALVSTVSFALYFSWIDDAQLLPQAIVLCCVCLGMTVIIQGYNHSFTELVSSRRSLHQRQIETEKLSHENRRIAFTDALTGLPNRRELLERLDLLEHKQDVADDSLAVVFIDLDGFKEINDEHGHQSGDQLISSVAQRLRQQCPKGARIARVGGDELAVLIEVDDPGKSANAQAITLASVLLKEASLPITIDRHVLQVGASIGVAANNSDAIAPRELLRRADMAMYHAKTSGKGQVALYSEGLDEGRLHRLEIEAQIVNGLAREEFEIEYQPIVGATSRHITGVEALLRWPQRPEGPLPPDQFIEIAESTGQIHPIGLYVLTKACCDLKGIEGVTLSVNVSPAQFRHPNFEQQVLKILEQTGFPPERLQLEITESYLLSNPERAFQAVAALKAQGIALALDDFGTGFTSIHYLQSYGFNHIKIDKSLTSDLAQQHKARRLVEGAIIMASALDIDVTAEGVENAQQADILEHVGCQCLQGYYFGRPMALTKLHHVIRQQDRSLRPAGKRAAG
ncbi:EAL domain-containing protein [Erythrobacter sp. SCSIO 43205]|nr:EAL domain-containing protein [Erythrobacter sp. SCSIO 43205]